MATTPKKKTAAPKKGPEKPKLSKKTPKRFETLKGMKDILPDDQKYWEAIRDILKNLALPYGFRRMETPLLENTQLFHKHLGETDIILDGLYSFEDPAGEKVTLRPEGTLAMTRGFVEHGFVNLPLPVKLYHIGPMFRFEKPQSGRYRQFHQAGFEVYNETDPVVDAQLIMIGMKFFQSLGLDVVARINNIGDDSCRPEYEKRLAEYFKPYKKELSEEDQILLKKNPLRLLDSKDESTREIAKDAPQFIDYLSDSVRERFVKVLEYLDELNIKYELDPFVVRGLEYYNDTVFEYTLQTEDGSKGLSLGGGGRYDTLVEQLGGPVLPASGFAIGIERVIQVIKQKEELARAEAKEIQLVPELYKTDIFVSQLGTDARKIAIRIFEELRSAGVKVSESFSKSGLKQQLEDATRLQAYFSLVIGQKEVMDKTVLIRDMENGIQETVDVKKVVHEVNKRLALKKQV